MRSDSGDGWPIVGVTFRRWEGYRGAERVTCVRPETVVRAAQVAGSFRGCICKACMAIQFPDVTVGPTKVVEPQTVRAEADAVRPSSDVSL